jgi:hypothetical protein
MEQRKEIAKAKNKMKRKCSELVRESPFSSLTRRCRSDASKKVDDSWFCIRHASKRKRQKISFELSSESLKVERYKTLEQRQREMKERIIRNDYGFRITSPIPDLEHPKGLKVLRLFDGHIKMFSSPIVYVFKKKKHALYIGMSANGIARCFSQKHLSAKEAMKNADLLVIHSCLNV